LPCAIINNKLFACAIYRIKNYRTVGLSNQLKSYIYLQGYTGNSNWCIHIRNLMYSISFKSYLSYPIMHIRNLILLFIYIYQHNTIKILMFFHILFFRKVSKIWCMIHIFFQIMSEFWYFLIDILTNHIRIQILFAYNWYLVWLIISEFWYVSRVYV
jgi:hypothetical protein